MIVTPKTTTSGEHTVDNATEYIYSSTLLKYSLNVLNVLILEVFLISATLIILDVVLCFFFFCRFKI